MSSRNFNDQAIDAPAEDLYGVSGFAKALAQSIRALETPAGTAIALNGPWGAGKTSAANLVLFHLQEEIRSGKIVVIRLNTWWFRGEEALALAFFRELYAAMVPTLGEKLKKTLPRIGARLLKGAGAVGGLVDLAGGPGAVVTGTLDWLAGLIAGDDSSEKLHTELAQSLKEQPKRFLVVVDDIDRLSPDEALLIFRLVKSVGRLPQVIYLLIYDRALVERIIEEKFASQGPHYLEKIVQAAFELPEPHAYDLHRQLLGHVAAICGEPEEERAVRTMNIFHDAVAPEVRTPRDVARLANGLSVTWPAVAGEVDLGDFLALETFRLLRPSLYRAIRQNKSLLCDTSRLGAGDKRMASEMENLLLGEVDETERARVRRSLMRLFPRLEGIWANMSYGAESHAEWARERRVCSSTHFESYFRLELGADAISIAEVRSLITQADDRDAIVKTLRLAATENRQAGGTKAAALLEELRLHAGEIDRGKLSSFATTLFSIADDLTAADLRAPFDSVDNGIRLHWVIREATLDRTTLAERSAIFVTASESAQLGWLASFEARVWPDHHPREGQAKESENRCLVSEGDAARLRGLLLQRIETASVDGSLLKHPDLAYLLHRWREISVDEGAAVRAWTAARIEEDDALPLLAVAFTSHGWTQGLGLTGLGDLVARRTTRASIEGIHRLLDPDRFRARLKELDRVGGEPAVRDFLAAWEATSLGDAR